MKSKSSLILRVIAFVFLVLFFIMFGVSVYRHDAGMNYAYGYLIVALLSFILFFVAIYASVATEVKDEDDSNY